MGYFVQIEIDGYFIIERGFSSPDDALTYVLEKYPECISYAINEEDDEEEEI